MAERNYQAELRHLADRFRDPFRLRIAVCCVALAIAYFGIYSPLQDRIRIASRKTKEAGQQARLTRDVEFLRAQAAMFEPQVSPSPDANESIQYILNGIRALPVKLVQLDSDKSVRVGTYEAAVLKMQVQGEMAQLDALLAWLETNERLLRVDAVKFEPGRDITDPTGLHLTLLALKVRS